MVRKRSRPAAPKRQLKALLKAVGVSLDKGVSDLPVTQVTDDSRTVQKVALFVAVRGARDGHRFVTEAIERGACALLLEEPVQLPSGIVPIQVAESRSLLGPLVHAFLGDPTRDMKLIGVTGTNGKTTVTWLIRHLLESAQISCGLIGTIFHQVGERKEISRLTTPGSVELASKLTQMLSLRTQACVMEVSSHALAQYRTHGIRWASSVLTNVTPEHLDYHGSFEQYLEAKLRLFKSLGDEAVAILPQGDQAFLQFRAVVKGQVLTYGLNPGADLFAREISFSLKGTKFQLVTPSTVFSIDSPLVGSHNVQNLLAAVAAVRSLGVSIPKALSGISTFPGVPGRLEQVDCGQPFPVYVDYAHTEDALFQVLKALRVASANRDSFVGTDNFLRTLEPDLRPGVSRCKILTVFGCGGDRDRSKRPRMGQVAGELSDRVIVTSDNPRTEDPRAIAHEILSGMRAAQIPVEVILDRKEAIRTALESVDEDWLVLIAGKGHESDQALGGCLFPFRDTDVVREVLGKREKIYG